MLWSGKENVSRRWCRHDARIWYFPGSDGGDRRGEPVPGGVAVAVGRWMPETVGGADSEENMRGQLEILHGLWAIRWEGGRVDFTRFPPRTPAERVLRAVRAEFRGFEITGPAEPGWLFQEMWEVTPLFAAEGEK